MQLKYPCKQCLENDWLKRVLPEKLEFTCSFCGYEFEIEKAEKVDKSQEMKAGNRCRKCQGEIIKKESKFKASKLKKPYYFTHVFYCLGCRKIYLAEEFKIYNEIN